MFYSMNFYTHISHCLWKGFPVYFFLAKMAFVSLMKSADENK